MSRLPPSTSRYIEDSLRYYTCSNCRFSCDKEKVYTASIYENAGEVSTVIPDTEGDHTTNPRGCPFCGSLLSNF